MVRQHLFDRLRSFLCDALHTFMDILGNLNGDGMICHLAILRGGVISCLHVLVRLGAMRQGLTHHDRSTPPIIHLGPQTSLTFQGAVLALVLQDGGSIASCWSSPAATDICLAALARASAYTGLSSPACRWLVLLGA